jgi:hypothetical protein
MPEDLMRYDLLAQEALRGVVRAALKRVKRQGFPGGHHFYIAFNTNHPGVEISERLHQKYDQEMTIVLQHQFWNLMVLEDQFSVELSFNDIPEKLTVPFAAIKGFFDPAVQFGLQFATQVEGEEEEAEAKPASKAPAKPAPAPVVKAEAPPAGEDAPQKIVSLDSFRKK